MDRILLVHRHRRGRVHRIRLLDPECLPRDRDNVSYVNPIVTMTLGWLLFSEPITWRMIVAMLISAVGVFLIVSTKSDTPD